MGKNIGKNISQNLSGKHSQKPHDHVNKSATDALKIENKAKFQKFKTQQKQLVI